MTASHSESYALVKLLVCAITKHHFFFLFFCSQIMSIKISIMLLHCSWNGTFKFNFLLKIYLWFRYVQKRNIFKFQFVVFRTIYIVENVKIPPIM